MIKICKKEQLKSTFFSFLKYFPDSQKLVNDFWEFKQYELKGFYLKQRKNSDIVISATPEILIQPVAKKYGFKLIGTRIDSRTGTLIGNNCYGSEKVRRLKNYGINKCKNFYTDSSSDSPLKEIAENFFIVKGNQIIPLTEYKESKLKRVFFNRDFITFLFIGGINVINGVLISFIFSLFLKSPIVAFVYGFLISLTISYLLNSLFNFKKKLCISNFIRFCISNIPNFIVQFICVFLLIKKLSLNKVIAYFFSAIIAVPITFALVKIKVFKTIGGNNEK